MIELYDPSFVEKYTGPDGALTVEGMKMFTQLMLAVRELQEMAEDHETRIQALEP